jgi:hypothetical protein
MEDEEFLRARVLYLVGELVDAIDVLCTNNIYKGIAVTHARQAAIWALKTKNLSTVESEAPSAGPALD